MPAGNPFFGLRRAAAAGAAATLLVLAAAAVPSAFIDARACPEAILRDARPNPDLYCIELLPAAGYGDATGTVTLGRVPAPFTASVTAAGVHRYELAVRVDGLPAPASAGGEVYIAWATAPTLYPVVKLGRVGDGRVARGRVALNKFRVLVTAEPSMAVEERTGAVVLRGRSASMRMLPHDELAYLGMALGMRAPGRGPAGDTADRPAAGDAPGRRNPAADSTDGPGHRWRAPPMHPRVPMVPSLMRLRPDVSPFLPGASAALSFAGPSRARPTEVVGLADGDTLRLRSGRVRRTIRGRTFVMYGFNGQSPGPLISVSEGAEIVVVFENGLNQNSSIHWHGIRIENRFDGAPGVTQPPVPPGGRFVYRVRFPDPGIYWYHPHVREDIQQDLGLYGNMRVRSDDPDYFGPAHEEQVLMLDDLLIDERGLYPYGRGRATHALMGRFGNITLVNGEPGYRLRAKRGAVVRFFLTNVANTRVFNLSISGPAAGRVDSPTAASGRELSRASATRSRRQPQPLRLKLVGGDIGRYEREEWIDHVVIAPAERYVVEARFPEPGRYTIINRVQGIDHVYGNYFTEVDTLGTVVVASERAEPNLASEYRTLRTNEAVSREIARYREHFDRPVDHTLLLTLETDSLPFPLGPIMGRDRTYFNPVEWSGTMPVMNGALTTGEVHWVLRDLETGAENMAIDWDFRVGDVVKIRLVNDRTAFHAMQHPIHLHGQRFLILSVDGEANENMVWKDTVLLPVGHTVDLLVEMSNPGKWMLHCHIAEHLQSGMAMVFEVEGPDRLGS